MAKRKSVSRKRSTLKKRGKDEDTRQRKKYKKGGRIEAYTFGEALGSKGWP